MNKVKPFTLGDRFFPDNKEKLEETVKNLFMNVPKDYDTTTRVILAPHAAYQYSGKVAANAFQYLDKNIKNVFIFSPAHYLLFYGIALTSYEKWETPMGEVTINQDLNKEIIETFDADYNDRAFEKEHTIEVQIPLIKTMLPDAQIVPVLFGSSNFARIQHIVDKYYFDKSNGFVFSADMTHTYSQEDAIKMDEYNAESMEQFNTPENFIPGHSPLSNGIIATTEFAREKGFSIVRVDLATSGELAGSDSKVEGYGSWMVVEENKPLFIKREFSDTVLNLCKNNIISGMEYGTPMDTDALKLAPVFDSRGSSFVTVKVDGETRGTAGSTFAYQPLKEDLAQNAYNAAFKNTGKKAIRNDELEKVAFDVCILTRPVPIPFINEADLLKKINEGEGLILRNSEHQAVFLPNKWNDYPDKKDFIEALKKEAGLSGNFDSKRFEAYKFKVADIR